VADRVIYPKGAEFDVLERTVAESGPMLYLQGHGAVFWAEEKQTRLVYATPPSRLDAESARAAAVEECARRVESTGLRNPDNIARDIRALVTDEMVDAGARALWRSSTYQGYNDETLEREWLRMCGIWRNQVRQVLAAARVPPPSEAGREDDLPAHQTMVRWRRCSR
jgi:hypothetical protein